jgi:predicted TIM-barrel fold metal-dependent hydrolase
LTEHLALVDHHCHGIARHRLDRPALEAFLTESDRPPPPGCSTFDSLLGITVRQRCAPLLDLAAGADPAQYVERRKELGPVEVNRRLLTAAGLEALLVDTGLAGDHLTGPAELAELSGAPVREILRLESLAEAVLAGGVAADDFPAAFEDALRRRTDEDAVVGLKSVVAYRHGLDFDPTPPSPADVAQAAGRHLAAGAARVRDPVLIRHLLWQAVETGLPLQLHTGFGDPDLTLHRTDPSLLTEFLRATAKTGGPVLLLHCYPFHRQAAYLAAVFPHVHVDIGLTIPHVGARAAAVLAETLELAPFHKLLYSSDAYGLGELYLLAAAGFRDALRDTLTSLRLSRADRDRIEAMIAAGNARRVYGLAGPISA